MKIISKDFDGLKSKCCNEYNDTLYSIKGQQGNNWQYGLCSSCFLNYLIENKVEVMFNEKLKDGD